MNINMFGNNLKVERCRLGLTQEQLGEKIDRTTNFIGKLESGQKSPSFETLVELSKIMSLDQLFSDDEDINSNEKLVAFFKKAISNRDNNSKQLIVNLINNICLYLDIK